MKLLIPDYNNDNNIIGYRAGAEMVLSRLSGVLWSDHYHHQFRKLFVSSNKMIHFFQFAICWGVFRRGEGKFNFSGSNLNVYV
jgi:hypothetical protein